MPGTVKSINPKQKHPHIIESYACILEIFAITIDLSINILISFGICSNPKLSKSVILLQHYQCIQSNPMSSNIRILIEIYYICLAL